MSGLFEDSSGGAVAVELESPGREVKPHGRHRSLERKLRDPVRLRRRIPIGHRGLAGWILARPGTDAPVVLRRPPEGARHAHHVSENFRMCEPQIRRAKATRAGTTNGRSTWLLRYVVMTTHPRDEFFRHE